MITNELTNKQNQAIQQEKQLIKELETYITTLKEINGKLTSLRYEIGTAGIFETQAPSLVLKSKTNQNKLNDLMVEMETINNEILRNFKVF